MKILALETSSKRFCLGVGDGKSVFKSRAMVLDKILSDSIVPAIDRILKAAKWKLPDLDAFVVGLGPGSFTSLRVGLSTVKAMSFALGTPVIGIPSMDAVALNVGKTERHICVLLDARRNMVYACLYENTTGKLKKKSEYLLTPLISLLDRITTDTIFVGDALVAYKTDIEKYFLAKTQGPQVSFATEAKAYPSAKNLMILAEERLRKKKFANIDTLVPLYLYPQDCQVQK